MPAPAPEASAGPQLLALPNALNARRPPFPCLPQIVKRGAPPLGGGEVLLRLPVIKQLPPVSLTDEGMVKRIRGVAYSARVSPQASFFSALWLRGVEESAEAAAEGQACSLQLAGTPA